MNTTETREVTIKELVAAFEGKYINVSSVDHYGLSIKVHKGTLEYEDDLKTELYLVNRDKDNNVTGSVCIDEEAVESIEKFDDGTYTINFMLNMTSVDVAEYKTLEELQKRA